MTTTRSPAPWWDVDTPEARQHAAMDIYLAYHTRADHFTTWILKLFQKADARNREWLRNCYPLHVDMYEEWVLTRDEMDFFIKYRIGERLREPGRSQYLAQLEHYQNVEKQRGEP